jgi:chemotaxis protein methyltransferase CheR
MTPGDIEFFCTWIRARTGLVLSADKIYLIESRLAPLVRRHNLKDLSEVIAGVRAGNSILQRDAANALMTHETYFFRDPGTFDRFRKIILPRLVAARSTRRVLRLWSAASSTGQEAYTLAMIMREERALLKDWRVEIVGTDISCDALVRAKEAAFTQFEVQRGLPIQLLMKYFKQDGERWLAGNELRDMVLFREFNLMQDPRGLGQFDAIFCRNVLIYFEPPMKARVLDNLTRVLTPGGVVYLGGAETVMGLTTTLDQVPGEPGVYTPTQPAAQPMVMAAAAG